MSKRYATIDIGTRGIRLLIADVTPNGIERVVYSTGELGELGHGLKPTGYLSTKSIENIKGIVDRYVEICERYQVDKLIAIATEILRVAKNQGAFLEKLAPVVKIKVLKPQEEALLSFLAAMNAFSDKLHPEDIALVVDQGGGSVELSCGSVEEDGSFVLKGFDSLGISTITLTKLLTKAKTFKDGYYKVQDSVRSIIENHQKFNALKEKNPFAIFALGNAITNLAKYLISCGGEKRIHFSQTHGHFVAKEDIETTIHHILEHMPKSNFKNSEFAVDDNYATFLCGILTYYYILQKYGGNGVIVNRHGLSYGIILWLSGKHAQMKLP